MSRFVHHFPGNSLPDAAPGDFILTHSTFAIGKLIRFGQALRFRGDRRAFAYFNHAALVVAAPVSLRGGARLNDGQIVEALGHGVERNELAKYRDTEFVLVRTLVEPHDEVQVLRFANRVLAAKTRYDFPEIISLGFSLAVPLPIQFGSPGTSICSGFVAEALTRAGFVFGTSPEYCMPADLAEHFNVVV